MPSDSIIPTPSSFDEAMKVLSSEPFDYKNVYRGMSNSDYGLVTSLGRIRKGNKEGIINAERDAFDYFSRHGQNYIPTAPPYEDITSWMILMQHYGAPTRLLDWTRSIYVSAYFAFKAAHQIESNKEEFVSIWVLNESGCQEHYRKSSRDDITGRSIWAPETMKLFYSGTSENQIVSTFVLDRTSRIPYIIHPRRPDKRITSQQGVLTVCPSEMADIDFPLYSTWHPLPSIGTDTQKATFKSTSVRTNLLWKMNLPKIWKKEALDKLNRMGINESTMFPNLEGIGRYVKDRITNNHLKKPKATMAYLFYPDEFNFDLQEVLKEKRTRVTIMRVPWVPTEGEHLLTHQRTGSISDFVDYLNHKFLDDRAQFRSDGIALNSKSSQPFYVIDIDYIPEDSGFF